MERQRSLRMEIELHYSPWNKLLSIRVRRSARKMVNNDAPAGPIVGKSILPNAASSGTARRKDLWRVLGALRGYRWPTHQYGYFVPFPGCVFVIRSVLKRRAVRVHRPHPLPRAGPPGDNRRRARRCFSHDLARKAGVRGWRQSVYRFRVRRSVQRVEIEVGRTIDGGCIADAFDL